MPYVHVYRDSKRITNRKVVKLVDAIPGAVSKALRCKETPLKAAEIEVRVIDRSPFDRNDDACSILIFAGSYPSRAKNRGMRAQQILEELRKKRALPKSLASASVFIHLGEAAFAQHKREKRAKKK